MRIPFPHPATMTKNKKNRKNKKYRPTNCRVPVALLHRLTVPESQILKLKAHHDAALLRMYMGTDSYEDRVTLYSVLRFGESLAKYVDDSEPIVTKLYDAMALIAKEPEFAEDGRRNLDIIREALDLVEKIWRLVSVEEFVREGRALKAEEEKQWKSVTLTEHGVVPLKPEERQLD